MLKVFCSHKSLLLTFVLISIYVSSSLTEITESENDKEIEEKVEEYVKEEKFVEAQKYLESQNLGFAKQNLIISKLISNIGFGLAFHWALLVTSVPLMLEIFKEISSRSQDPQRPINLTENCDIYQAISQKILLSNNQNLSELYDDAQETLQKIRPKIVNEASSYIKHYLKEDGFPQLKVQTILQDVFFANESVFDETICKVIDESYNDLRFANLVTKMWQLKYVPQKAAALICIFRNLERNINNNLQAADILGDYLKKLKTLNSFKYLQEYKLNEIRNIVIHLPQSVRNKYFPQE